MLQTYPKQLVVNPIYMTHFSILQAGSDCWVVEDAEEYREAGATFFFF